MHNKPASIIHIIINLYYVFLIDYAVYYMISMIIVWKKTKMKAVKMKKNFYLQKLLMRKKCRIFMVNYSKKKRSSSNIEQWPMKVPQRIQLSYQHFSYMSEWEIISLLLFACLLAYFIVSTVSERPTFVSFLFSIYFSKSNIVMCLLCMNDWLDGFFKSSIKQDLFLCWV